MNEIDDILKRLANLEVQESPNEKWTDWTPTLSGWSVNPTNTVYRYRLSGKTCTLVIRQGADGTSDSPTTTLSLPFTAATITNMAWVGTGTGRDNGNYTTSPVVGIILSAGTVITFYPGASLGIWTATGGKRIGAMTIVYEIA